MDTIDTWQKKQESDSVFAMREGESPLLKFVQVGIANRVNTAEQSMLLTSLRMFGLYMGFDWIKSFCDFIEDYQTTCGSPHAAREMLLEAIQFDRWAAHDKNKASLSLSADGGKK